MVFSSSIERKTSIQGKGTLFLHGSRNPGLTLIGKGRLSSQKMTDHESLIS